jgi:hypothetical protein
MLQWGAPTALYRNVGPTFTGENRTIAFFKESIVGKVYYGEWRFMSMI